MKLKEAKDTFYESSETLSQIIRNLVFAGIGIVWILKVGGDQAGGITFKKDLLLPLGLFTLSITLDVLQYLYKTTTWWIYYEFKHRNGKKDSDEVDPSGALNVLAWILFYGKIVVGLVAFVLLLFRIGYELLK